MFPRVPLKNFLAKRSGSEVRALVALALAAGGVLVFLKIADEIVFEGEHALDRRLAEIVRPVGSAHPIGPAWAENVARDITSLGSTSVLTLVAAGVTLFLLLARKSRTALYVAVASLGGTALVQGLKPLFGRARPDLVPEIADLASKSFPSGHATMSATLYLTLAALVARTFEGVALKSYVIGFAMFATMLVGFSRVYLGYHWPSDVAAGWTLGAAWALFCWSAAEWLEGRLARK